MFRGRLLPKTIAVLVAIALIALGLIFVPMELQLEAEGKLEPQARRDVFAPIDGEVIEVLADHSSVVKAGDPLIRLRNRQIEMEMTELLGQIQTTTAEFNRVRGILTAARRTLELNEQRQLQGEEREFEVRLAALREKLQLQTERAEQLIIRAPIDGIVMSWDVEKTLRSRPVMTGQVLLEIADLSQPLYLELQMPDKRMGHLDRRIRELDQPTLPVRYVLATHPDEPMQAELPRQEVQLRAQVDPEHGSTVKMRAIPDREQLEQKSPRPGAKVIANVQCGKRAAGGAMTRRSRRRNRGWGAPCRRRARSMRSGAS